MQADLGLWYPHMPEDGFLHDIELSDEVRYLLTCMEFSVEVR